MRSRIAAWGWLVLIASPASAQTTNWVGPAAGGTWETAGSWSNGVPTGSITALFTDAIAGTGTTTVTYASSASALGVVTLGTPRPLILDGNATNVLRLGSSGLSAQSADLTVNGFVETFQSHTWQAAAGRVLTVGGWQVGAGTPAGGLAIGGDVRLGAGGVSAAAANTNLSLTSVPSVAGTLTLTADQTWAVGNGRTLAVSGLAAVQYGGANLTLAPITTSTTTGPAVIDIRVPLIGGGTLTVNAGGAAGPAAGVVAYRPTAESVPGMPVAGAVVVQNGTLFVANNGFIRGQSVQVTGGQLVLNTAVNRINPDATLTLSDAGAYNVGLPVSVGGAAANTPLAHTQTYTAVNHGGTGAFVTGGGSAITVTNTFFTNATGSLTVSPNSTLSVNRLDLQSVASGGAVTVLSDPGGNGVLAVTGGGLNLAGRTILLQNFANNTAGGRLQLDSLQTVTASGTARIIGLGPNVGVVLGGGSNQTGFNVASGGTLTIGVPLTAGGRIVHKGGAGTLLLTAAGTLDNFVLVQQGRLVVGHTGAVSGATKPVLYGGTLSSAGGTNGAGVSATYGAFQLGAVNTTVGTSVLELGTGGHELRFGDFFAGSTEALRIDGWDGAAGGRVLFGSATNWDTTALARVTFTGYTPGGRLVAFPGGGFELVPVPEPAFGLFAAVAGLVVVRRRRLALGIALVVSIVPGRAAAQTDVLWNLSGGGAWNAAASWNPQTVPTLAANNTAVFGSAITTTGTVTIAPTADASAVGLRVNGPAATTLLIDSGLNNSVPMLQLGAGGIDLSTNPTNVTFARLNVSATTSQTWDVRAGRLLTFAATSGVSFGPTISETLTINTAANSAVLIDGAHAGAAALTVGGAGLFAVRGTASAAFVGPTTVTGGVFSVEAAGRWAANRVALSGTGNVQIAAGVTNALATTTALTMSGSSSFNTGFVLPGTVLSDTPQAFTQTFASVGHASSGAFRTGAGSITVSGTFASSGTGTATVNPAGTLTVNRLDLQSGGGTFEVRGEFVTGVGGLTGVLSVGAGGLNLAGRTLTLNAATGSNFGGRVDLRGDVTASGTSAIVGLNTGAHRVGLYAAQRAFDVAAGGTLAVNAILYPGEGVSTFDAGLVKRGAGTLVLAQPNSYRGFTRVEAGTLRIGSTIALPDSAPITLAGGTLSTIDPASGAGTGDTTGGLAVTEDSTIALGTGAHGLRFGVLSGITAGKTLRVTGWQGTPFTAGTAGRITIADNPGLTADNLGRILFDGFPGGAVAIPYSQFGFPAGFELVPVPEPAGGLLAAAGLAAYSWGIGRPRRRP